MARIYRFWSTWRSAEEPARRISVPTLRRLIVEVVAGPGGAGYFGWSAAARTKTGREAMALRDRLIAALVRALGNRPRS